VLFSAVSCSSSKDNGQDAFAGSTGAGAAGGHAHGGTGGAQGGAAGTSSGGSAGRAGTGGTAPHDAGHEASDGEAADANDVDAAQGVNGCVEFDDRSAGDPLQTMPWDDDITYARERCMKVRVGQTVIFAGDFEEHPLAPRGGDTPSPIAEQTQLTEVGVFGFFCTSHPNMNGAIWVVAP
jgi:hypothetical protein